jgi:prepilin-type N-terminal cleavage/methylation domain-containing protein
MKKSGIVNNEKGFTLVELAIVLVIIGIILGGIIKGQELINNAKLKRAYSQYKEITAAFYTYYDRYGKFPGDDNTALNRTATWTGFTNGDGNGLLGGGFQYNCTTDVESCNEWLELRMANIITGSPVAATGRTNPQNSYGSAISVAYGGVNGINANWMAFQSLPTDAAQALDLQNDDGVWNTGSIQTNAAYTNAGPLTLYFRF